MAGTVLWPAVWPRYSVAACSPEIGTVCCQGKPLVFGMPVRSVRSMYGSCHTPSASLSQQDPEYREEARINWVW